jgi:hypothetical protein
MSNNEELKRHQEQLRQEKEARDRREAELQRIKDHQINKRQQDDIISKGKPTGGRPDKDD